MSDIFSESEIVKRDVPSFIEPRPPLITNPFMRPRPQKGTNLMDLFEEDSECEESELVQVYLRLKPCNVPSNLYDVRGDRCLITSLDTTTAGHGRRTQHNVSKMYTFSHIFRENASQKDIFDHVVKENLKKLPEGRSFTLLTYGASGSGKTFTLMGTVASPGLVPRSLEYLFKTVEVEMRPTYKPSEGSVETLSYNAQEYELLFVKKLRKLSAPLRDKYRRMSSRLSSDLMGSTMSLSNSTKHYVWVSFIEIYNEGIYDLLATTDRRTSSKLLIREDSTGNVYVKGATQAFVRSGEEAYDVMVAGKHNLQVAATGVHAQSSRSHCIFTITMLTETEGGCATSCVRLCDLAGCERARRTRNTGARMQESRAINSSLHVLERCLHTLRRKQAAHAHPAHPALVPYRESKLTRLLGAGLSGTRGEAVSMVVTLNPSPEYAHETRHVLQLAAVAKDLQINNTVSEYPSSLESSTHDTSSSLNSEILKLRTRNERLHFELLQAQARNRELMASIEEKQAANADTMRELVEEVQENCRQYYEPQIQTFKKEIEELKEEYEDMISDLKRRTSGTPSRSNKIDQLMTENTILKEKLTAERLARSRAEEEVQHLRACIDERDENDEKAKNDDHMSVNESDNETESDDDDVIYNESLEPTFTKEDIDRSRLIRKSLDFDQDSESSNDSVLDESDNTLKDTSCTNDDCAFSDNIMATCKKASILDCTKEKEENDIDLVGVGITSKGSYFFNDEATTDTNVKSKNLRDTFCISKPETSDCFELTNSKKDDNNSYIDEEDKVPDIIVKETGTFVNKLIKTESIRNDSLAQFEQLELASKVCTEKSADDNDFGENLHKKLGGFFDDTEKFCNSPDGGVDVRSPSIVHDEAADNYEASMIKKLLKKNLLISIDDKKHSQMGNGIFLDSTENQRVLSPEHKFKMSQESVDLFDSPHTANTQEIADVENLQKSHAVHIENIRVKIEKDVNISRKSETALPELNDTNETPHNFILPKGDIDTQDINKEVDHYEKQIVEESDILENIVQKINIKEDIINNEQINSRFETDKELFEIPILSKEKREIKKEKRDSIVNVECSPANCQDVEIKNLYDNDINDTPVVMSTDILNEGSSKESQNSCITNVFEGTECVINLEDDGSEILPKSKETISVKIKEEKITESDSEMKPQILLSDVFKVPLQKGNGINKIYPSTEITCERPHDVEEKETSNIDVAHTSNVIINNTLETFENIYKDITLPRPTQFDLLVSRTEENDENLTETERKYNLRKKSQRIKSQDSKEDMLVEENSEIRDKKGRNKTKDIKSEEILLDSNAKEAKTKRSLRLRRRKDNEAEEKLKDIVNLQTEFSDVTLDTPAPDKVVQDIPSPEKNGDENVSPILGIQSCPSKSVARSRRKLFTPRAEPLEEGCPQTVDSNEQIRVPRPSYHRPRARRKL